MLASRFLRTYTPPSATARFSSAVSPTPESANGVNPALKLYRHIVRKSRLLTPEQRAYYLSYARTVSKRILHINFFFPFSNSGFEESVIYFFCYVQNYNNSILEALLIIFQHYLAFRDETDPERIDQIIRRSYQDVDWVLAKVLSLISLSLSPLSICSSSSTFPDTGPRIR